MLVLLFCGLLVGMAFIIFPRQAGVGFCKLGKWIWRTSTFGLTDMRWFYPEDKAPSLARLIGVFLVAVTLLSMVLFAMSFSGPGTLFALREAGEYLERSYGSSGGNSSISASKDDEDGSILTITYRHGDRVGTLKGRWAGEGYVFSEVN